MEAEILKAREEELEAGCMALVAGNTALKLRVMALEDSYVVLELREVGMVSARRALAKGVVLNENPVVNFKVGELENESSELEARSLEWDAARAMWLAKEADCQRKVAEMRKNLKDYQQ